jgi:predicted nucleic acid-binding protein
LLISLSNGAGIHGEIGFGVELGWSSFMKPATTSTEAFTRAMGYAQRSGTQFWDALILATCAEHGVTKLYTEDIGAQRQALGIGLIQPF